MKKKFLLMLISVMLIFGTAALADEADIGVTETGLSVSFTAPESGGIYVIGAEYDGEVLKSTVVRHIDNAVSGENYTAELTGFYGGSIYIWNDDQKPLYDKQYYGESPTPTNAPTDNPENTPTAEPDNTPDPSATPTPIPEGGGIIHLKNTEIDASGVDGVTVDGTTVTITSVGSYIIEGTLNDGQIVVSDELGKNDAVNITLDGVNVTCSDSAPFNAGGGTIEITLADGTTNTFTDTSEYTNYTTKKDPKGTV